MAVLTCALCRDPVPTQGAIWDADDRLFCCHACRELFGLLPEGALELLERSRPADAPDWDAVRSLLTTPAPDALPAPDAPGPDTTRTVDLEVGGLWCASCSILLEHVLKRTEGVIDARVDAVLGRVSLVVRIPNGADGAPSAAGAIPNRTVLKAQERARRAGYTLGRLEGAAADGPASPPGDTGAVGDSLPGLTRRLSGSVVLALFVMMGSIPIWSHSLPLGDPRFRLAWGGSLALPASAVVVWGGWPFLQGAVRSVREGVPTMDLLVSLGSLTALALSLAELPDGHGTFYFDTACMLTVFLLLGRTLEVAALDRAGAWVQGLTRLLGHGAFRLVADTPVWVPRDALHPGDRVWVAPGSRIPADGRVESGRGSVDTSALTGESFPRDVHPGAPVAGGTLCLTAGLTVYLERSPRDSLLWETVRSVEALSQAGGRIGRLADRVVRVFVPGVLVAAALTAALCLIAGHLSAERMALRAAAVLVVACPCALGVAIPLAALTGTAQLLKAGVLVRRGESLERAGRVDTLLFDKTGTLTDGRFVLTDVEALGDPDPRILTWVARAETGLRHPVAQALARLFVPDDDAIRAADPGRMADSAADVSLRELEVRPGFGVRARIGDHTLEVGVTPSPSAGEGGVTTIGVWLDGVQRYRIGLRDGVRAEVPAVLLNLRHAGYDLWLLSGDSPSRVLDVARTVGIPEDRALGGLTPADKVRTVERLRTEGRHVAMVGDGLNDAAALALADLGIAMGTGTDVAAEASGFVLARGDLGALPDALGVATRVTRVMRRNLTWALGYNALALPAAMAGLASPALAALCMTLSSAFVLGNSLALSGFAVPRFATAAAGTALGISAVLAIAWLGL